MQNIVSYKTLKDTPIEIIYESFIDAFSDYQVKMNLPIGKFRNMLRRRGYCADVSMGAFVDGGLVGFILNGLRSWHGIHTVYDAGTGVVGEYRRQGITTTMFMELEELLQEHGVGQYLLEVIKQNATALELYRKQGFKVVRSFSCYQLEKNAIKVQPSKSHRVEHVACFDSTDWEHFKSYWNCTPSWQNSIESIDTLPESMIFSVAYHDDAIAGYAVADRMTGDVPQLAVDGRFRRNGIASSILADLIESTESQKIVFLNVDDDAKGEKRFLETLGFRSFVEQYEMLLEL